jgi:hypothetical protein
MINGQYRMNPTKMIVCYQYKTDGEHINSGDGLASTALRIKIYGVNKTGDGVTNNDTLLAICPLETTEEYIGGSYAATVFTGIQINNYNAIYYAYEVAEPDHECIDFIRMIGRIKLILDIVENPDKYLEVDDSEAIMPVPIELTDFYINNREAITYSTFFNLHIVSNVVPTEYRIGSTSDLSNSPWISYSGTITTEGIIGFNQYWIQIRNAVNYSSKLNAKIFVKPTSIMYFAHTITPSILPNDSIMYLGDTI